MTTPNWATPPYYEVPASMPEYYMDGPFVNVRFSVDYGMGLAIDGDLKNPNYYFNNNPALDDKYRTPIAYAQSLVAKAEALKEDRKYHKPEGWEPIAAGLELANKVFKILKEIPCNRGDETSNNLLDSWAAGTGQNYGGHTLTIVTPGDGMNTATGQSAAPPGTVL